MDEILASIRRIISDDHSIARKAVASAPVRPRASVTEPVAAPFASPASRPEAEDADEITSLPEPSAEAVVVVPPAQSEAQDMSDFSYSPSAQPQPAPRRTDIRDSATTRAPSARPSEADPATSRPFADSGRRKDLVSPTVDAAVTAAFESLGDLVLPAHERTVEDLVKEILRPMLKSWLDENLPHLVERLVRQEIERISRNAR
jgi:cell pole-organizing protein PopZ